MEGISIFNSVTLIRGADPESLIEVEAEFFRRDGYAYSYTGKRYNRLSKAILALRPLVFTGDVRYLFCIGRNGTLSVYSNFVFGSAAGLTAPAAARIGIDYLSARWNDYALARKYDKAMIPNDPDFDFRLEVQLQGQNVKRERTIDTGKRSNGDIYVARWGELFPFENADDYAGLEKGIPPGMHILEGFCGLFGWPPPTSPDYPEFIESCILYEFEPTPELLPFVRPVSKALQREALRWPWPEKNKGLRRFIG